MKLFPTLALTTTLLLPSVSFAKGLPILDSMKNALKRSDLAQRQAKEVAPQCADFSGNWQGTCTNPDGRADPDSVILTQKDCTQLTFYGLDVPLNGAVTLATSPSRDAVDSLPSAETVSMAWNDSQTVIRFLISGNFFNGVFAFVQNGAVWIAGDQLHIKYEKPLSLGIDGGPGVELIAQDCVYSRH